MEEEDLQEAEGVFRRKEEEEKNMKKKQKSRRYFTEVHEAAILDYIASGSRSERNVLYRQHTGFF